MGGLGNQLFQYATGRALSSRLGTELAFDLQDLGSGGHRVYGLDVFDIAGRTATPDELAPFCDPRGRIAKFLGKPWKAPDNYVWERTHWTYDPCCFPQTGGAYLEGYWQTERYFRDIESQLRRDLQFVRQLPDADKKLVRAFQETPTVSVHVRRGDYVHLEHLYGPFNPAFYDAAAQRILDVQPDATFMVFSDDPPWAAQNLRLPGPTRIVSDGVRDRGAELYLMAACKHHIVPNSTFSWWGAWLGGRDIGITIAPRVWGIGDRPAPDIVPDWWERA